MYILGEWGRYGVIMEVFCLPPMSMLQPFLSKCMMSTPVNMTVVHIDGLIL